MPHRINITGDLGTVKIASDSYDIDNVYFSEEGWVYRHYKNDAKTKWWDEIIVAGQVTLDGAPYNPDNVNVPVIATVSAGDGSGIRPQRVDLGDTYVPTFEGEGGSGDDTVDFEYSPLYPHANKDTLVGGGVPTFDTKGDGTDDFDPESDTIYPYDEPTAAAPL